MKSFTRSATISTFFLAVAAAATSAQAQGVRYTLAPSAEYVWWDSKLGLEDAPLFGGRLSADFGSLLSVSGYYHRATNLGLVRDSLLAGGARQLGPLRTSTDVTTFGGNLALRLSPARLAPFVSAGAGVIRFDADSVARRDQINYRYGAGIQYDPTPNIRAMLMVEDSRFRLAPGSLFSSTTGGISTEDRRTTRSSWTASAGLGIAIGGALDENDDGRTERWSLASVPLELFAGRLEFDDKSIARQAMIGARGGIDLGQYVGLRGFYWQGRSGNLREKQPMQSYGGEAQFNFTRSRGPSPFLILGAGRLDFGNDYRDLEGRARDVETALIAGAGVAFRLTDNFRLNVAVRDYVRGPQDLDSVATTDQLSHNWMYTAGIGIDLGRSRRRIDTRDERRDDRRVDRDDDVMVERVMRNAERRRRMMRDSMDMRDDSVVVRERRIIRDGQPERMREPMRTPERPTMITLPAPTVGEIYVRYGDSTQRTIRVSPMMGGRSADSMMMRTPNDSLVRQLRMQIDSLEARLRNQLAPQAAPAAPREAIREEEIRALRERLDSLERQLRMTPTQAPPGQPSNVVVMPSPGVRDQRGNVIVVPTDSAGRERQVMMLSDSDSPLRIRRISGYVAGFSQLAFGVQLDAGTVLGIPQLRLVPDFAIGVGNDPSVSLAVGAQYDFEAIRVKAPGSYRPFLRGGLGFLAAGGDRDSEFGVNVAYGVTYQPARNGLLLTDDRRPQYFVEHQGINFFSTNRFLVGVRWNVQ